MKNDQLKWNKRYLNKEFSEEPSEIVQRYFHLAKKGKALDIACGMGRNALFLAQNGFQVDAVDISDIAIHRLQNDFPQVNWILADLDHWSIPSHKYDLILNINFLQRRLFPYIIDGLLPGGILIFETFLLSEYEYSRDADLNPDYLLRENELLHSFLRLKIIYYEEHQVKRCNDRTRMVASLVAQKT